MNQKTGIPYKKNSKQIIFFKNQRIPVQTPEYSCASVSCIRQDRFITLFLLLRSAHQRLIDRPNTGVW